MSSKLSRTAQRMITRTFGDEAVVFPARIDRVTINGVTFLLNNRAIEFLNQQAFENAGQYGGCDGDKHE